MFNTATAVALSSRINRPAAPFLGDPSARNPARFLPNFITVHVSRFGRLLKQTPRAAATWNMPCVAVFELMLEFPLLNSPCSISAF